MPNWLYNVLKAIVGTAAVIVPVTLAAHPAVAGYTLGAGVLAVLLWLEGKFGVQAALTKKPVVKA